MGKDQKAHLYLVTEAPEQHFERGKRHLQRNQLEEAYEAFRRAYAGKPGDARYMSFLGLVTSLKEENNEKAIAFCARAVELAQTPSPDFYLNLGRVYLLAAKKHSAADAFRKGLRFYPEDEHLRYYINLTGCRRRSMVSFLDRSNLINKWLGIFFRRIIPGLFKKSDGNNR